MGDVAPPPAPPPRAQEYSGSQLLAGDLRTGFILINETRHVVLRRLFGVPKDQENLLTLIVLLMLAGVAHDRLQWLFRAGPSPTLGDGLLAGGAVEELVCAVAGPISRRTPATGPLLIACVVLGLAGPSARRAIRSARGASHRISTDFHGRYGWLVDPGHRRRRRALRRAAKVAD